MDAYCGVGILLSKSVTARFGGPWRDAAARPNPNRPAVAVRATTERPVHAGGRDAGLKGTPSKAGPSLVAGFLNGEEVENARLQALGKRPAKYFADIGSKLIIARAQAQVCVGQDDAYMGMR